MKKAYRSIMAMSLFLMMSATGFAEDIQNVAPPATPPKDAGMKHEMGGGMGMKHGMGGGMGMGMHHGMGGMMAGMSEEQKDKHLRSMQEHMLKMHDLSNQILAEKEATKKEQLKAQQLQLMKEHHAQMMEHHKEMKHPPKK